MLVSFSVSNFRSFGQEETLNMVASNKLVDHLNHRIPIPGTDRHVLRSTVIYGANAAGKSNLIKAMSFAQKMIRQTARPVASEPFRFNRSTAATPSSFEFRFLLGEKVFAYGFDITGRSIDQEWLTVRHRDNDVVIFERERDGQAKLGDAPKQHFSSDPKMRETLEVLTSLPLRPDQLFLNRARSLPELAQGPTLSRVIQWLTHDLTILSPEHRTRDLLGHLASDSNFKEFAASFLDRIGTGINTLEIDESEADADDFDRVSTGFARGVRSRSIWGDVAVFPKGDDPTKVVIRKLQAAHLSNGETTILPFSEESDGTRQILHLLPVLAPRDGGNKVVVIDELDRSLHPLLCWEFIRFFSETPSAMQRQLIVTTHEAHLLNQELLRRDEYWFVEKDEQQQSRLVPLSEFKIRNDLQIERGYLQGRFGAIPIIGSMADLQDLLAGHQLEEGHATQKSAT